MIKSIFSWIPIVGDHSVKLSFVPREGSVSNYLDCKAIAKDGSKWKSVDNRWVKC